MTLSMVQWGERQRKYAGKRARNNEKQQTGQMLIKLIFAILCGCLYVVGLIFGLDYKQVSVLVCCWVWPAICTVSTLPILYVAVKNFLKCRMALSNLLFLLVVVAALCYSSAYYSMATLFMALYPNMDAETFERCMSDLLKLADKFGISYEVLNLLIYVVLFAAIIAFNIFLCWLLNKGRIWIEEKFSKSKFIMAIERREAITTLLGMAVLIISVIGALVVGLELGSNWPDSSYLMVLKYGG